MRIAVWHNLPSGGGKRALYHHVKGLAARGHHVEVWCPPEANRTYLPLKGLAAEHVVAHDRSAALGPPRPLGRFRQGRREQAALDDHCRRCAREINAGGFDVLFAGNCQQTAVAPIARHVRLPSALYHNEPNRALHEARPHLPWAEPLAAGWKEALRGLDALRRLRYDAREERASAAAFTLLLANSAFSRESIARAYGLDSKLCYLGIDAALFRPGEWPREPLAVGLGAIHAHKGVELAVEAIAAVPAALRPPLVWIGNLASEGYRQHVETLAAQLGVALTLRSLVSDEELVNTLGRAAVMIYPPRLEPFGFAPLEANACATPVAAVAEGGVRETIVHGINGLLVPDRDPAALGCAVQEILANGKLGRRLGEAGAEVVRSRWTWDAAVDRLERHLCSLVGRV